MVPPPGGRLRRGLRAFAGALSDDELARRAAAGDEHAFAVLFARRADHLHVVALRVLHDHHDARDAVQGALVKGLLGIRRGQLRGDVRPWMNRICLNEALDLLRVRTPWLELDEQRQVADDARSPEATLLLREQLRDLAADLATLPDRQRRAFLLREVAELPYERVATLLRMRPDAARQAVAEARRALRELAEGREDGCAAVRALLVAGDGRSRRARRLRAHLRGCPDCRAWDAARRPPRRGLAGLLPGAWLPKLLVTGGAGGALTVGQLPTVAAVVAIASGGGGAIGLVQATGRGSVPEHRATTERPTRAAARAPGAATASTGDATRATAAPAAVASARAAVRDRGGRAGRAGGVRAAPPDRDRAADAARARRDDARPTADAGRDDGVGGEATGALDRDARPPGSAAPSTGATARRRADAGGWAPLVAARRDDEALRPPSASRPVAAREPQADLSRAATGTPSATTASSSAGDALATGTEPSPDAGAAEPGAADERGDR